MSANSTWVHPTEYALKDYTKEQLIEYALWLQKKLDEQHKDIKVLSEQLDRADIIIEHYTKELVK